MYILARRGSRRGLFRPVEKMKMQANFSLGLGELVREGRELIKDVCYRNRQEREKGDLEILQKRLDLISQYNLSPDVVQIITTAAIPDAEQGVGLVADGHLQLEAAKNPKANEL